MAYTFQVQDVVNRMGDWLGNYSTGQATTTAQIRAVDYAVNILKRQLGFPQDELKTTFNYSADTFFYTLPTDFQDPIGLFFDANVKNFAVRPNKWEYRPYQELFGRTGNYPALSNMWTVTSVNGSWQAMLLGNNTQPGGTLDTLSAVNSWKATDGATSLTTDSNNFPSSFNLNGPSLTYTAPSFASNSVSSITNSAVNYSILNMVANNTYFYVYMMTGDSHITNVQLALYTNSTNYYTYTATTDYLGAAFSASTWQKIQFTTPVLTGTPSSTNITKAKLTVNSASGFAGASIWFNTLYYIVPDKMDLYYYTQNKGTNASGTTITKYSALSDQISYDYDFLEPIALIGAGYLQPQLRADVAYMQMYKQNVTQLIQLYSRSHPKIRTRNDRTRTRIAR